MLTDTSFIVATISENDKDHGRCMKCASTLHEPLTTTLPCITEAMHLLHTPRAQESLMRQVKIGVVQILALTETDLLRAFELMRKYSDSPMDFADASLVVAVESLKVKTILTLDSHFYAYQIDGKFHFAALP